MALIDLLQYEFIRNALLAAVLTSIACGIIGSIIVVKRIVFVSGGIAHTAFGGIGLGFLLGVKNLMTTIIPFSILGALIIGFISKKAKASEDTAIGMVWAGGMALGILFIGLTPGYTPDLMSYLFGNILTVPANDLWLTFLLDIVLLISIILFYNPLLSICFDEEYAETRQINAFATYLLLLCLIALSLVVLIRVVGIILVISMLTIPASIARKFTYSFKRMMIYSSLLGSFFTIGGLAISYIFNLPSGATIILLSITVYILITLYKLICEKK